MSALVYSVCKIFLLGLNKLSNESMDYMKFFLRSPECISKAGGTCWSTNYEVLLRIFSPAGNLLLAFLHQPSRTACCSVSIRYTLSISIAISSIQVLANEPSLYCGLTVSVLLQQQNRNNCENVVQFFIVQLGMVIFPQ